MTSSTRKFISLCTKPGFCCIWTIRFSKVITCEARVNGAQKLGSGAMPACSFISAMISNTIGIRPEE